MALEILVLAAGVGKRMRSSLPKVLQPLAGRPLLAHVLATARALSPRKVIVVHGHGAEAVREAFNGEEVEWVLQGEQLGTAHAVMQAMPRVSADADVLILYGDVPLTRAATLKRLLEAAARRARGCYRRAGRPGRPTAASCATLAAAWRRSSSSAMPPRRSARSARSMPASMRSARAACRDG